MNCKQCQEKWIDHREGLLSPDEQKEWENHFQSCSFCREEIQSLKNLQYELRGIPPANPLPPIFWRRQTNSILERIEKTPRRRWIRFWESLFQPQGVLVVAALVVVLFFGVQIWLNRFVPIKPVSEDLLSFLKAEGVPAEFDEENEEEFDLNEEQTEKYYAYLMQKYLPRGGDDFEEEEWVEDLNEEELDRVIEHFEKDLSRRVL